MKTKPQPMSHDQEVANDTVIDYTANMFQDGNNRTEKNKRVHDAPGYDAAVKVTDPDISDAGISSSQPVDVAQSRDGTQASGELDEDGGSLGGTETELDALEASGAPVDRTPQMKG